MADSSGIGVDRHAPNNMETLTFMEMLLSFHFLLAHYRFSPTTKGAIKCPVLRQVPLMCQLIFILQLRGVFDHGTTTGKSFPPTIARRPHFNYHHVTNLTEGSVGGKRYKEMILCMIHFENKFFFSPKI